MPSESSEDEAREHLLRFDKWLEREWRNGDQLGRVGIVILLLGMAGPFLLAVIATIAVWIWIVPIASDFSEKLAAFGVLFSLLTALSVKIAGQAEKIMGILYVKRPKRKSG